MNLVETSYISDFTKRTLQQFGWTDGDPIPADLGDQLVKLKETLPPTSRTDVLIDATLLPETELAAIKDLLAQAKAFVRKKEQQAEREKQTENMSPSVRDAYAQLFGNEPQIVDDRATAPAEETPPAADPPAQTPEPVPEPDAAPAEAAPVVNAPVRDDVGVGPMLIPPFCPRCGWDMARTFDVDVTDSDKIEFLAILLGSERFRRDFPIAGGKMVVRFRSMLADENFLVHRQLLLDQDAGDILSADEWFLRLSEYRMACSLEAIYDDNGKAIVLNPQLSEVKFTPPPDKPTQTALPLARQNVNTRALLHEVTRRLVAKQLSRFQRLVEALEAMALEPSFWEGIDSPR